MTLLELEMQGLASSEHASFPHVTDAVTAEVYDQTTLSIPVPTETAPLPAATVLGLELDRLGLHATDRLALSRDAEELPKVHFRRSLMESFERSDVAELYADDIISNFREYGDNGQAFGRSQLRPYFYLEDPFHRAMHDAFWAKLQAASMGIADEGPQDEWHLAADTETLRVYRMTNGFTEDGLPMDWTYMPVRKSDDGHY
jgi:hypothetical protein